MGRGIWTFKEDAVNSFLLVKKGRRKVTYSFMRADDENHRNDKEDKQYVQVLIKALNAFEGKRV